MSILHKNRQIKDASSAVRSAKEGLCLFVPVTIAVENWNMFTPVPWKWIVVVVEELFWSKLSSTKTLKIPFLAMEGIILFPDCL